MLGRLKARGREVKAVAAKVVTAVVTVREEEVVTVAYVARRDTENGQRSLVLVPRAQGHAALVGKNRGVGIRVLVSRTKLFASSEWPSGIIYLRVHALCVCTKKHSGVRTGMMGRVVDGWTGMMGASFLA